MSQLSPPRKLLIQMSGAPGSGKSTMANLLARSIDGVVINHDLIKSFFLENDISFAQSSVLTYHLDWVLAEDMIRQGRNVIMDSICNYQETLDQGMALAQTYDYDYKYIETRISDITLLEQRLHDRESMRCQRTSVHEAPTEDAKSSDEDALILFRKWMDSPCRPASGRIIVDSTSPPEECLEYILDQINPTLV